MKKILLVLSLITVALFISSCDKKNITPTDNQELTGDEKVITFEKSGEAAITVIFTPTDTENLPRIVDLNIKYDPKALALSHHTKGESLSDAQKEIFVDTEQTPGIIRVTALNASNINKIPAGSIVTLEFKKLTDEPTTLSFDETHQVFAPANANNQVTFGDGITL